VSKAQQIYNILSTHIEEKYTLIEPHPDKDEVSFSYPLEENTSLGSNPVIALTLRVLKNARVSIFVNYLPYPQYLTSQQRKKLSAFREEMNKRPGCKYYLEQAIYQGIASDTIFLSTDFSWISNLQANLETFDTDLKLLIEAYNVHYLNDFETFARISAPIRIFVGSATEALPIANVLKDLLTSERYDIILWTDIFPPGKTAIQSLVEQIDKTDLAIFLFTHDDTITIRDEKDLAITRDRSGL
jgi:hypothetical protein